MKRKIRKKLINICNGGSIKCFHKSTRFWFLVSFFRNSFFFLIFYYTTKGIVPFSHKIKFVLKLFINTIYSHYSFFLLFSLHNKRNSPFSHKIKFVFIIFINTTYKLFAHPKRLPAYICLIVVIIKIP